MKRITSLIGVVSMGLVLTGCTDNFNPDNKKEASRGTWVEENPLRTLMNFRRVEEIEIFPGERYFDYAKMLQEKYPEKLKGIRRDQIAEVLKTKFNNGKTLKYGTERKPKYAKIPVY